MARFSRRWAAALGALAALAAAAAALASPYSDFNAGLAMRGRDDDQAVQYLSKALGDPTLPASFRAVALRSRALTYDHQKKRDLALADYSASLALRPDYDGYVARGLLLFHRDQFDAALADFAAAQALRPDLFDAPFLRVTVFMARDRFDDAIAADSDMIAIFPQDPYLYAMRASAYRGKGDYERAMADAAYAIGLHDDSPEGYYEKASIYEDQGRLQDALDAIMNNLRIAAGNFAGVMKRGVLLWELKRYREAETVFAGLLKKYPDNGYLALWLLITHRAAHGDGDVGDALKDVDLERWPGPVVAQLRGTVPPDATLAAAHAWEGNRRDQICDAEFYGAQWYLQNNNPAPAEPLIAAAAHDCGPGALERGPARLQPWK